MCVCARARACVRACVCVYFIGNIVLYNCFTNAYRQLNFLNNMYHKIVGKYLQ